MCEKLTKVQRELLINQYKILSHLDDNYKDLYKNSISILENGYTYEYNNLYNNLLDEISEDDCRYVYNVLSMYRFIYNYINKNPKDKVILDMKYSKFLGFDGNNEGEYMSYTKFLIDDKNLFEESKNDKYGYNSLHPMKLYYDKMLNVYNSLDNKSSLELSVTQYNKNVYQILDSVK